MSEMSIFAFADPEATNVALVGGKGANLALCTQGGLPVPPGFTISTRGYAAFIRESGLDPLIRDILADADYTDTADIEARTVRIREAITTRVLPDALVAEIASAYAALGHQRHVAVRSSGTAEDMPEASFAGMHDTFLNVCGQESLIAAVRACWASLWADRAIIYRNAKGLNDIETIRMAVVVQLMVDAEVSGVMFTANPITTATDEIVINASWGLGEAIVQGLVTPDEYVIKAHRPLAYGFEQPLVQIGATTTLKVKACTVGTKEQRMVRDPATGHGTVTHSVAETDRARLTLTDVQVIELAELGRRVQAYYDDIPQDIEWGFVDGRFYVLQSRPITGVAFDWAADMDSFQWAPDDPDALWTGAYAQLVTGAKSPLYYHWVTCADSAGYHAIGNVLNIPELSGPAYTHDGLDINRPARHQVHKYYRSEVYFNTEVERLVCQNLFVPMLRTPEISQWMSPEQRQQVHEAPFSYVDFLKSLTQVTLIKSDYGIWQLLDWIEEFIAGARQISDYNTLPDLTSLSDEELKEKLNEQWFQGARYTSRTMVLWMVYCSQMITLFSRIIQAWYKGDNPNAFAELCQGVTTRSKTLEENLTLHQLSDQVRASSVLSKLFADKEGAAFFDALADSAEGRGFLENYRAFVREHGHRGHEDRCFSYPRRWEDPSIDYRSIKLMLSQSDDASPVEKEEHLNARREAVYQDVLRNLQQEPLTGAMKAQAFSKLYAWVQKFLAMRDDERWAYEMAVFCTKLYCREVGRRCAERGILVDQEDFLMFTKDELFDMLDGRMKTRLARAKAAQRRIDHNRALQRTQEAPAYLRDGREVVMVTDQQEGGLSGTGWTTGTVTATARVVYRLSEINRVMPGEILVCQSTDPGWTPVFMLLAGIVVESGGVLSHAVCLSREYGLPAVQLPGARKLIPDGATVTINGATGQIVVVDDGAEKNDAKRDVLADA